MIQDVDLFHSNINIVMVQYDLITQYEVYQNVDSFQKKNTIKKVDVNIGKNIEKKKGIIRRIKCQKRLVLHRILKNKE